MTVTAAFDLSALPRLGFCVGDDKACTSGTLDLTGGRFEGEGMRYLRWRHFLEETFRVRPFGIVTYREAMPRGPAAAVYGELLATLGSWCEDPLARGGTRAHPAEPVLYQAVTARAVKEFAVGNRNAPKEAIMTAVRTWGYSPSSAGEAGAVAIWHMIQAHETRTARAA